MHIFGAHEATTGQLWAFTRPRKRGREFVAWLRWLDRRRTDRRDWRPVFLVLDNGPIHTCKEAKEVMAGWPWLHVVWLPLYASELNPVERDWLQLKQRYLANEMFDSPEALDLAIRRAIRDFNRHRARKCVC